MKQFYKKKQKVKKSYISRVTVKSKSDKKEFISNKKKYK